LFRLRNERDLPASLAQQSQVTQTHSAGNARQDLQDQVKQIRQVKDQVKKFREGLGKIDLFKRIITKSFQKERSALRSVLFADKRRYLIFSKMTYRSCTYGNFMFGSFKKRIQPCGDI
jgi:hypothetical protein